MDSKSAEAYPRGTVFAIAWHLAFAIVDKLVNFICGCCTIFLQIGGLKASSTLDDVTTTSVTTYLTHTIQMSKRHANVQQVRRRYEIKHSMTTMLRQNGIAHLRNHFAEKPQLAQQRGRCWLKGRKQQTHTLFL